MGFYIYHPVANQPTLLCNVPGLLDANLLVNQASPIVAANNQVIENLDFTTKQAGPHITIPNGVTGVVIRNNRFADSGANIAAFNGDGGAIMATQNTGFVIEHNHFVNCFRALRVEGGAGGAINGQFMFNTGLDLYRNFIFVQNANVPGFVCAYNSLEWLSGNFKDDYLTTTGDGNQIPSAFHQRVEDAYAFYNSFGSSAARITILGNRARHRRTNGGDDVSTTGAGYSTGDNNGGWFEVRQNLSWNTANNGLQASSGNDHWFFDNVIYHDGHDTVVYGTSGGQGFNTTNPDGAFITNRGVIFQNYNNGGCPSGNNISSDSLVYYQNNFGVTQRGFQVLNGCTPPAGNDPLTNSPTTGTWTGATLADIQQRWDGWQTDIDSLVTTYGSFGSTCA